MKNITLEELRQLEENLVILHAEHASSGGLRKILSADVNKCYTVSLNGIQVYIGLSRTEAVEIYNEIK